MIEDVKEYATITVGNDSRLLLKHLTEAKCVNCGETLLKKNVRLAKALDSIDVIATYVRCESCDMLHYVTKEIDFDSITCEESFSHKHLEDAQ